MSIKWSDDDEILLAAIRERDNAYPDPLPGHYQGPIDRRELLRILDHRTMMAELGQALGADVVEEVPPADRTSPLGLLRWFNRRRQGTPRSPGNH